MFVQIHFIKISSRFYPNFDWIKFGESHDGSEICDLDDFLLLIDIFVSFKDCSHTELVANGVCNDESNNAECNFDGGDCSNSTTTQATTSGKKIEIIPKIFLFL